LTEPLDDEARALIEDAAATVPAPAPGTGAIEAFRAVAHHMLRYAGEPEEVELVEGITVPGAAGELPARRYRPAGEPGGLMLFLHGGGFVRGDLDTHDPLCRRLANAGGCELVAVDYRLAPEHPFPAGLEDSLAALRWAGTEAAGRPLAVGGDSSGANFAAVAALAARDSGSPALAAQLLLYPVTDATMASPSLDELAEGRMLTRGALEWMYETYLAEGADPVDPRVSPLHAASHAGVAPAVIVSAGNDPLRDDATRYAERLERAGVPVAHIAVGGTIHSFLLYAGALQAGRAATAEVGRELGRLLQTARNSA
jgi:acetyl esterase